MRASRESERPFSTSHDVFSSVDSRVLRLRVAEYFSRECHKDFSRTFTVENAIQKVCNLSHAYSSCTVARSSNRVILDAHFSPSMLPSRSAAPRYNAFVVAVNRSDPPGDLSFIFAVVEFRSQ